jgi:hypothetical protein
MPGSRCVDAWSNPAGLTKTSAEST